MMSTKAGSFPLRCHWSNLFAEAAQPLCALPFVRGLCSCTHEHTSVSTRQVDPSKVASVLPTRVPHLQENTPP